MNTRNKRASAIWPLLPFRTSLPAPDGTVSLGDKQQVVFLYSGISAQGQTPATVFLEGVVYGPGYDGYVYGPGYDGTVRM